MMPARAPELAATLAQQGPHAARALWLTALLAVVAFTLILGLMFAIASRRRTQRLLAQDKARSRAAGVDPWVEAGRRLTSRGPAHPRELLDSGEDDDTRDLDPPDRSPRGPKA